MTPSRQPYHTRKSSPRITLHTKKGRTISVTYYTHLQLRRHRHVNKNPKQRSSAAAVVSPPSTRFFSSRRQTVPALRHNSAATNTTPNSDRSTTSQPLSNCGTAKMESNCEHIHYCSIDEHPQHSARSTIERTPLATNIFRK